MAPETRRRERMAGADGRPARGGAGATRSAARGVARAKRARPRHSPPQTPPALTRGGWLNLPLASTDQSSATRQRQPALQGAKSQLLHPACQLLHPLRQTLQWQKLAQFVCLARLSLAVAVVVYASYFSISAGATTTAMGDGVPPRAVGLVKAFVDFHERLQYYLLVREQQEMELLQPTQWIAQLCAPTDEDVVRVLEDRVDVYTHPCFIRLLYRDDTYRDLREHNICLLDALEVQCPRGVVQEFFNHLHKLSAEDRARSFLSLASEVPSDGVDGDEDEERIAWLDRIADSFTSSPRALRPQLLLPASIIGHTPMVAQVLRDLGTDDEQAPNIDAVEAECLIEAATNQHFLVVKELLDGGRFSNGNETRWDAVVQALEVSCTNGCADITDILLSHYLSYCSVISACGAHHLRLLRLALANWHFENVELLLECDPRGTLCNVMELIDTLREEIAQASQDSAEASSGLVAIIVGEENDDMGDLVMWDAAALARGVSSENTTLVRFLVNHVDFCPETLTAALEAAEDTENLDMVQVISNQLMKVTNHCRQEEIGDEMAGSSPSVNLIYSDEEPLETWAVEDNRIQSDAYEDDARDGACIKHANHDEEYNVKAVSHTILPSQPAMMDAVRTASFKEVGCVISAATHSVVMRKVEAASQADLVRASTEPEDKAGSALKLESNALPGPEQNDDSSSCEELTPKLEDGTLAESEQCARTSPNKELTLLRQFSSNTVDEMVCEGKLAAVRRMDRQSDIVVEEQTEIAVTTDGSVAPSMVEKNTNESEVTGSDPSTETITIDVSCNNTVHFSKECVNPGDPLVLQTANPDEENEDSQYEDENERKTVYGTEDIMVDESIMPTTSDTGSTGESTDSGIASCSNLAKENFLESGHCSNPDSEKPVSAMTPLSVVTTVHNLVDTTVENFKALGTSDSEQRERTQVISEICYNVVACTDYHETKAVLPPQVLGTSSRTPAASPNRSTIMCPVKWEHIADVSESSVRTEVVSVPLHEGDHVEVHYKGRPVLFPGVIAFCHSNGVYDVVYEDGEEETCVSRDLIQLVESYNPNNSGLQNDGADENEVATLGAPVSVSMSIHCSRSSVGSGDFGLEVDGYCETAAHADVVCRTDQDEREDNNEEGSDKSDAIIAANEDKRDFDSQPEQVHVEIEKAISIGHFEPVRTDTLEDPGPNSETTQSGSNHFEVRAAVKEDVIKIEHLPEIPSLTVPSSCGTGKNIIEEIRLASGTSKRSLQDRSLSITSHRSRCRTADNVSAEEVAEWKNVDLLLNRKRRLFQSQTGSVETTKVPWGEEFATIQSLKRFAAQHPDILRAHIESQLRELDGPLSSNSPGKSRSPRTRNSSAHSGAGQARGCLLLMKDLAFLLQHRLSPFFDAIVPVVLPTVFNAEKRFLCETAAEVLDAIILHCSGRKLALLFLQLGETYSTYEDLRLYNLTSVYVEKCVCNWSKSEFAGLSVSQSSAALLTLLARSMLSKSAPVRISVQKTWRHIREELGARSFEDILRVHLPQDLQGIVINECRDTFVGSVRLKNRRNSRRRREAEKPAEVGSPTIVQSGPSILQRMLLHRQNRVLPSQT